MNYVEVGENMVRVPILLDLNKATANLPPKIYQPPIICTATGNNMDKLLMPLDIGLESDTAFNIPIRNLPECTWKESTGISREKRLKAQAHKKKMKRHHKNRG
jgi:hypothetical protein